MAAAKSTSVKALARLRAERDAFDKREREARRDAAIELGEAVLKAADLALEPAQVAALVSVAMKHGLDSAMALLTAKPASDSPPASPRKTAAIGAGSVVPNGATLAADSSADHVS